MKLTMKNSDKKILICELRGLRIDNQIQLERIDRILIKLYQNKFLSKEDMVFIKNEKLPTN